MAPSSSSRPTPSSSAPIELVFLSDTDGPPLLLEPALGDPRRPGQPGDGRRDLRRDRRRTLRAPTPSPRSSSTTGPRSSTTRSKTSPSARSISRRSTSARVATASSLRSSVALGSQHRPPRGAVRLDGEGAEVNLDGLYLPRGDQHHDNPILIEHAAPRCTSRQLYKGIVDDHGHGVFNGRIIVRPGALGTDASQTNKNLLLSDQAEVDTRPRLEIFADDVKCTHGASRRAARRGRPVLPALAGSALRGGVGLLTYGFAHEMLDLIPSESLRAHVETLVAGRLSTDGSGTGGTLR